MSSSLKSLIVVGSLALLVPFGALADGGHHKLKAAMAAATDLTDGEVRKVDLELNKLTLRRAEIKSLDMPAMTMVFVVKDNAMIEKLKAGDKIKFKAISEAGKYTVTEIQPAP